MPGNPNASVTAANALLGSLSTSWAPGVSVCAVDLRSGVTGATTKSDGYLLVRTRGTSDGSLQPRLRVDESKCTSYGALEVASGGLAVTSGGLSIAAGGLSCTGDA